VISGGSLVSDDDGWGSPWYVCWRESERERERGGRGLWIYKIIPRNGGNKSLVS